MATVKEQTGNGDERSNKGLCPFGYGDAPTLFCFNWLWI